MANDRLTACLAQAAIWSASLTLMFALVTRELGPARGGLSALAIVGTVAIAVYGVIDLSRRTAWGRRRWLAMACLVLSVTTLGHAVFARLGMTQSFVQDLVNITLLSGVGLVVRFGWEGLGAQRRLSVERALRQDTENKLAQARREAGPRPARLPLKVGHQQIMVDPRAVSHIEADGNFATVHQAGSPIFVSESLKALAERFEPLGFIRVHRSFVINADFIQTRRSDQVTLTNGRAIPVGRAFR